MEENHNRVLIVSDGDYFQYDQKLLFYIMRQNIVVDCISITNNKNVEIINISKFYKQLLYSQMVIMRQSQI